MAEAFRLSLEIRNSAQALALLEALGIGALLGLAYDLLRPPRHRAGRLTAAALDALFCAGAFWAAFCFAMASGSGRLGVWELAFMLLAFLGYMRWLSGGFLSVYVPLLRALETGAERGKKIIKKILFSTKLFFQKVRECFIIKQ